MRAFIHYIDYTPFNADCASAERGFQKLGIPCVSFSSHFDLAAAKPEDVVIAGKIVTKMRLRDLEIFPEDLQYPINVWNYLKRKVWESTPEKLCAKNQFPVFVKPVEENLFRGQVVCSKYDFGNCSGAGPTTKLWCSQVLDIESEWRCYVKDGKILGIFPYYQRSSSSIINELIVASAVSDLGPHPAGCSLDFAATSTGETVLIEANDGYALGNYGLDDEHYALLLLARWNELITTRK